MEGPALCGRSHLHVTNASHPKCICYKLRGYMRPPRTKPAINIALGLNLRYERYEPESMIIIDFHFFFKGGSTLACAHTHTHTHTHTHMDGHSYHHVHVNLLDALTSFFYVCSWRSLPKSTPLTLVTMAVRSLRFWLVDPPHPTATRSCSGYRPSWPLRRANSGTMPIEWGYLVSSTWRMPYIYFQIWSHSYGCSRVWMWLANTVYDRISLARIFAKGSYYVLGQKFRQSRELPSRKLWVELANCYVHMYACECVKIFTVQKIRRKNFHERHSLAKLVKNFSWRKFPCIWYMYLKL